MRVLTSLILPFVVLVVVPLLLLFNFQTGTFRVNIFYHPVQILLGVFLCLGGLTLLVVTVRMFAGIGQGTLAPWIPRPHPWQRTD